MPVADALFAVLPAPEDVAAVQLAVEVDQADLRILEDAADAIELLVAVGNLARNGLDLVLQIELLGRLAPLGIGAGGQELVTVDEIAPLWVERGDIRDDAADERQCPLCLGDGEVLGHDPRR